MRSCDGRCVTPLPNGERYEWEYYEDSAGNEVALGEVEDVIMTGNPAPGVLEDRWAFYEELLDAAEYGELGAIAADYKPVMSWPEMREIAWWMDDHRVRIYHSEPPRWPRLLLLCLAHIKRVDGSQAEITRRQNQYMTRAHRRAKESL